MHHLDFNEMQQEKAWRELHKNSIYRLEQILEVTQNSSCMATYLLIS